MEKLVIWEGQMITKSFEEEDSLSHSFVSQSPNDHYIQHEVMV